MQTVTPEIPVDKENIYCRIFGTLRIKDKEKLLMILKIVPIAKLNEITTHLYDVILVRTLSEKRSTGEVRLTLKYSFVYFVTKLLLFSRLI